jgi:hypothetical protein
LLKQQIVAIAILIFLSAPAFSAEVIAAEKASDQIAGAKFDPDPDRSAIMQEVASPLCASPLGSDVQDLGADNAFRGSFNAFDPSGPLLVNPISPFVPPFRYELYEPVPLVPMGYSCKGALLDNCETDARFRYTTCVSDAEVRNWVGIEPWFCQNQLALDLDFCRRGYGCPADYDCVPDAQRASIDYCCPYGKQSCGGACLQSCNLSQYRNPATCACECLSHCRPPLVNDPETCACKCPTVCPTGYLQNPRSCACTCPDGLKDCNGRCVDLQTDRESCGSCGTKCSRREDCCSGSCRSLDENANCGKCSNDCSAQGGKTCCAKSCADLKTDRNNCGSCGHVCPAGQNCCNGTCAALNTVNNCGACGRACAAGQGCCNGQCTSLATTANCGGCGNVCIPAQLCPDVTGTNCQMVPLTCAHGGCVCPAQWGDCSNPGQPTFCCEPGHSCNKMMAGGVPRSFCCPPGRLAGFAGEGRTAGDVKCCETNRLIQLNGVKICCQSGVAATGGDTGTPVCCSETRILFDGQPQLIFNNGAPVCRFL